MRSISGVRGIVDTDLTPALVTRYAAAFGLLREAGPERPIVLARDSRRSGPRFAAAAQEGLALVGADVVDCGLVPTPTGQLAVEHHRAAGGIIVTASHNPIEWNALKFVGPDGLFLDADAVNRLFAMVDGDLPIGRDGGRRGVVRADGDAVRRHLDAVLRLPVVDRAAIRDRRFTVALDCVRGAGGTILPSLLEALGCRVVGVDLEPDGEFPRPPEPVPEHLDRLAAAVRESGADLGMASDPDADRLALVDETGRPIGEDYTLALAVRAVLERQRGPVVVNLSTSLVVDDAARPFGAPVIRAPVGEANVARAMQRERAVVGGEGNGGVMLPALHLGRDAPLAVALVLDVVARSRRSLAEVVAASPGYAIVKVKVPRRGGLEELYAKLGAAMTDAAADRQDGLRLAWPDRWLHVRPSGTEPVLRLIAEAPTADAANDLVRRARALL